MINIRKNADSRTAPLEGNSSHHLKSTDLNVKKTMTPKHRNGKLKNFTKGLFFRTRRVYSACQEKLFEAFKDYLQYKFS